MPIFLKPGSLNLLVPSGPVLAFNGIALTFTCIMNISSKNEGIYCGKMLSLLMERAGVDIVNTEF